MGEAAKPRGYNVVREIHIFFPLEDVTDGFFCPDSIRVTLLRNCFY